jgi:DNA-binding MarR family transcriptional regulator
MSRNSESNIHENNQNEKADNTVDTMRKVMHSSGVYMRTQLEALGLYGGQPKVLILLSSEDGLTKKALAQRFEVTAPTITKMIERLEKNGFVCTKKDTEDRRITRVYLEDRGRAVLKELKVFKQESQDVYFKGFTEEEIALLQTMLERVRENILSSDAMQAHFERHGHHHKAYHKHCKHHTKHHGESR